MGACRSYVNKGVGQGCVLGLILINTCPGYWVVTVQSHYGVILGNKVSDLDFAGDVTILSGSPNVSSRCI